MEIILYAVIRVRLAAAKKSESPRMLLEQLNRMVQKTVQTNDGKRLTDLIKMTLTQKSLFAAFGGLS